MPKLSVFRVISAIALCSLASVSFAKTYVNEASVLQGRSLSVQVQDEQTGAVFPIFRQGGAVSGFVGGETGHSYKLSLSNSTNQRLMVVVSVDGVNVITGQDASIKQSGYVIAPYSTTVIDGWRKSLNNVAKFVFSNPRDSYASQTGRPANVGVIGFAVFKEAQPMYQPEQKADMAGRAESAAPAARAAESGLNGLGTGHGQIVESQATTTTFKAASDGPFEVISLRYDSLLNLERLGIAVAAKSSPNAFPADGFVSDPPARVMR